MGVGPHGKVKTTYIGDDDEIALDLEALSPLKDMDRIDPPSVVDSC